MLRPAKRYVAESWKTVATLYMPFATFFNLTILLNLLVFRISTIVGSALCALLREIYIIQERGYIYVQLFLFCSIIVVDFFLCFKLIYRFQFPNYLRLSVS